jgi:hypothetical protein
MGLHNAGPTLGGEPESQPGARGMWGVGLPSSEGQMQSIVEELGAR